MTVYIIIGIAAIWFFIHFIMVDKYHQQDSIKKRIIKRDIAGAPIHLLFTIGDGFVFMGIFTYCKDITKEQAQELMILGISIIIIATILYRWLQKWFEKDEHANEKRDRSF